MERCNARTMEIFRRLGVVDQIRAAGLSAEVPMDVFVILAMNEPPLLRLAYPSVAEARADGRATNDGTAPCEPYQLISQYTLEPLLKSIVEKLPSIDVRFATEFLSLTQDADGVTAMVRSGGKDQTIRARYLVGCDGGASPVRKELGIKLRGENLSQMRQALFRCDELFDLIPIGPGPTHGRHYHVADDKSSFLIMQDSKKHWTLHATVESDEEMKAQFEKVVGVPVKYEMLFCAPWRQNLLVADRYNIDRVFLAGDSVHLVIPTGGLGMNTGVGDAIDLGWKLAATIEGWGGPEILASYEIERRQIGDRNVGASRYASLGRRKWRGMWRPEIRDKTPEGKKARDVLAHIADIEQRKTNEMVGAELGYRYVASPIVSDVPGGPEHLFRTYEPTTWPGARLPNVWLSDGAPIQDRLPAGYSLLRLGTKHDASALKQAFAKRGAPLAVIDIAEERARDIYGHDLVLVRPDLHVVWRGNALPDDAQEIADIASGHMPDPRKVTQ